MTEILEECTKFLSYFLLLALLPSLSNSDPQMFQGYGWVVGMKLFFESFIKTFNFTCDIWMAVTVMMVALVFIVWLICVSLCCGVKIHNLQWTLQPWHSQSQWHSFLWFRTYVIPWSWKARKKNKLEGG